MQPLDNHDIALKRATFWLSALIAELDVNPADTNVTLTLRGDHDVELKQTLNLADDLRAFAALGARSDLFDVDGE